MISAELPAGGVDIGAQCPADRGVHAQRLQFSPENLRIIPCRPEVRADCGIDRYEIDMGSCVPKKTGELSRVVVRIIVSVDHRVLIRDPASCLLCVIPAGFHQFLNRIPVVDRHNRGTFFIVRRMERDGKRKLKIFLFKVICKHRALLLLGEIFLVSLQLNFRLNSRNYTRIFFVFR